MTETARRRYRDLLTPEQRQEAEARAFTAVVGELTSGQRNQLARFFREVAAGEPALRMYISDLIEGRERL